MSGLYKDTIIGSIREYEESVTNIFKLRWVFSITLVGIIICLLKQMIIPFIILVGFSIILVNTIKETKQAVNEQKDIIKKNIEKFIAQIYFEKTGNSLKLNQKCNIKCDGKINFIIEIETFNIEAIKVQLKKEFATMEEKSFKHLKLKILI